MPDNTELDKVIYGYTSNASLLEEENKLLKKTVEQLNKEIERFKAPALMVCELKELLMKDRAIIKIPNGNEFLVNVSSSCEKLMPGDTVVVEQKNLTVIKRLDSAIKKFNVEKYVIIDYPKISEHQIGGLTDQLREITEVVELPLKKPELFKKIGIKPPKGILLHGPPGTGKTLMAKYVAASSNSTFIEVVGSELVQKFIGEGAKLIKEIFDLARAKAPSIVFIDEIDSLAARRIETGTSGEREVNRTFMQLLAELDGFKPLDNVKIIGATNRIDILDPAMLRPGRLDRIIEVPTPDENGKLEILKIHTKDMKLDKKIDLKKLVKKMGDFSGAEIRAVATEAGYFAIRSDRINIIEKDLLEAIEKVKSKEKSDTNYLKMFG